MIKLSYLFKSEKKILCLIFLISSYLLLHRLDNAYFWDDEAEVAIFAKNFLKTGKLLAWDGRNLMAFQNATTIDDDLISRQPPLMFWVTALSFYIFGPSTWSGRFPFALIGLASLLLFYSILKKSYPKTRIPLYGVALMGFSTDFLLLSRQCRYYSLILFFCLWIYLEYLNFLEKKSYRHALFLGIATSGLFYAHFLIATSFIASLSCLFLYRHILFLKKNYPKTIFSAATFLILSLPYAIIHRIWFRPDFDVFTQNNIPWYRPISILLFSFRCLDNMHFHLKYLLLFLCILIYFKRYILCKNNFDLLFLGAVPPIFTCVFLSYIIPYYGIFNELFINVMMPDRYLFSSYPFFWAGWSFLIWNFYLIRPLLGWLFFILFFAGDLFFVSSSVVSSSEKMHKIPLLSYLQEIHQPFPTAIEKIQRELLKRFTASKKDLTILAVPNYESLPLIFYVGDQCLLGGQLHASERNQKIIRSLNAYYLMYEHFYPDLIVSYGHKRQDWSGASLEEVLFDKQQIHQENNRWVRYQYIQSQILDVFFYNGSRGYDFYSHTFGPTTDFNKDKDAVYIYERKETSSWDCKDFCVNGISRLK